MLLVKVCAGIDFGSVGAFGWLRNQKPALRFSWFLAALSGLGFTLAIGTEPAAADDPITGYIFNNTYYNQNSNSAPSAPAGYFFNMGVFFTDPTSYTNGSVTYPGPGTPQTLPAPAGSTQFNYSSSTYSTNSALHIDYPFGTYTFTANGGSAGSATAVVPYAQDYFTSTVPYVTNFSSLNGLNTAANFTVNYNSFVPNSSVPDPSYFADNYTFFTIYDVSTGMPIFSDNFLDPSTTSSTILANTLLPGTDYVYELDFSNRLDGYDSDDGTFTSQGFDLRTDGSFTTGSATPLPPAWPLMMSGIAGLFIYCRRGMRKKVAAGAAA
jgi:hypothetical protein